MNSGKESELEAAIESDQITENVLCDTISRLSSHWDNANDVVATATMPLLVRIANSWSNVNTLVKTVPERCSQDIGAIFRIMFEAYIQLQFILIDPENRQSRAQSFIEYEDIDKLKQQERIFKHDTAYARLLGSSPLRGDGEKRLRANFSRIATKYLKKKKHNPDDEITPSKVRDHWYEGSLRDISIEIGVEAEYDLWVGLFHGCIHSSYFGCKSGSMMGIENASFWASQIAAHSSKAMLDYAKVNLTTTYQNWIDVITENPLGSMSDEIESAIQNTHSLNDSD